MGGNLGHNDDVQIEGGTDKTMIGNVGDRLNVDSSSQIGAIGAIPVLPPTLISEDMNVSTGGIARDTLVTTVTWVDVYSVTGSGLFIGFIVNLEEEKKWRIRLVIDGNEVFGSNGISTDDLHDNALYGLEFAKLQNRSGIYDQGFNLGEHTVNWEGPMGYPVAYSASVVVKLIKDTGASKKFRAGLATRTT
jgi:hypothetical protein